jgi:hypothetical protein
MMFCLYFFHNNHKKARYTYTHTINNNPFTIDPEPHTYTHVYLLCASIYETTTRYTMMSNHSEKKINLISKLLSVRNSFREWMSWAGSDFNLHFLAPHYLISFFMCFFLLFILLYEFCVFSSRRGLLFLWNEEENIIIFILYMILFTLALERHTHTKMCVV